MERAPAWKVVIVILAVIQSDLQQSMPLVELEKDLRRIDPIRRVEMAPDLKTL